LDVIAFERSGYKGVYHVLHGVLSPVDGMGPEQLRLKELMDRCRKQGVQELIVATNPDVEGEATASYIQQQLEKSVPKITRLAHGLPMGADIEFADQGVSRLRYVIHMFPARDWLSLFTLHPLPNLKAPGLIRKDNKMLPSRLGDLSIYLTAGGIRDRFSVRERTDISRHSTFVCYGIQLIMMAVNDQEETIAVMVPAKLFDKELFKTETTEQLPNFGCVQCHCYL